MVFFTSLLPFKKKAAQVSSSAEFNNSACKYVQQELDISETTWVETYMYDQRKPLADDIAKTLQSKPKLLDNELAYEYSGGKKLSWCK